MSRLFLSILASLATLGLVAPISAASLVSGRENRTDVGVTIYTNGLALIREVRNVALPKGESELKFMDVASAIIPATVYVRSPKDPRFFIIEQNYEYDLLSESRLLDKYIGKTLSLVTFDRDNNKKESVDAVLLSNQDGTPVFRIEDKIFLGYPGTKVLPQLPGELVSRPTLTWLVSSGTGQTTPLEVSYLTEALTWKADYVVALDSQDTKADLTGWVTLDNQSGAAYDSAALTLVAGEVNRVATGFGRGVMKSMTLESAAPAPEFVENPFFEYHTYNLSRRTTLKDKQTKQITLNSAKGITVKKEYIVRGNDWFYWSPYRENNQKQTVAVELSFENKKGNNLGIPLPMGTMRIYKKDLSGNQQFAGEDRIEHTPRDEIVRLKLGEAFDIVAKRTQTDFKKVSDRSVENSWKIVLRNHKDQSVKVNIEERFNGEWKILATNLQSEKIDAFTARFVIDVPAGKEADLTYRVKVSH